MKKRPILNAYETKIFNEWIADGNAVETEKGVWVEQSTQYRKKFTYEELQNFFKKEYLTYKNGGSAKDLLSSRASKVAKKEKSLNLKAYNVPSVPYAINPLNEGLDEIFQDIIGKDEVRERMNGVDFVENTATGTDAHKLLHLVGKREGKFKDGNYYLFSTMENEWSKNKFLSKEMSVAEYYKQRSLIEERFPNWIPIVYDSFDYKQEFNLPTLYDVVNSLLVSKLLNKEFNGIIIEFNTKDGAFQVGFNAKYLRSIIKSLIMAGIINATGYFNTPRNGVTIFDTSLKFPNKNKRDEFFMENSFGLIMPIMIPDEETLEEVRKEGLKMAEFDNLVYEFPIIRVISPNEYEIEIYGQDTITYSRGKSIQIKSKKTQPKATPQSTTKTTDKKTALGNKLRKGMVVRIEYKESNGSTLSNDLFFDDGKFIKYILITDKKGKELSETEERLSESELNEYYKEYKEYIIDEFYENMADGGQLGKQMTLFNTGGKIGFDALAKKVAKRYAGEKVEPQYQAEYGKKYSKSEAEEVGRKVAGKVYWQQQGRKFNGGGGVETVKKDRYGNEVRIGDAIRIKVLTGRYGQTKIYEGVVTNFGLFGKVELDGQRELTYTANYIHNDYEHGHHIWVEKINENDINENLRVPKKFVPSYSGTINGEKFGISGKEKFKEWLNENYPNSIFDSWYNLYNKGWRLINNEYVSPEKVPYTEVSVYESAETGQGFLYSLMIPKAKPQSTTKNTDKKTALGNKLRKGMVVRIEFKESNGSTLSNDLFFDDGKFIKYVLITDKKGKELSETEETLSESELNEYYKEYKEYIIDEFYENMAEGGGVPNLNKMFHLPIEMAVYVPSTQDVNNVISVDEMDKRVREVKEYLANKFGGYTSAEKIGGFVDSQAELVNEEVVQITAFSTKEAYEENKEALVQKLSEWAKEWGQEAIGFEYEGDLMYVPQKFNGGGKAIRQTHYAVYKLLDKEGLVKYFTDKDLEKFLEEWNEDYNTDYEDFVEFNEYERDFIIKPVFSKNDMGGTASQPSFLEIQINDVSNWENYELANYLDAPISLVEKNRNFYIKEVQNEMMLNVIPNYAGGGSLDKKYNFSDFGVKSYRELIDAGKFSSKFKSISNASNFDRIKYNRMRGSEQVEYVRKLNKQKIEYNLKLNEDDRTFYTVKKEVFDYADIPETEEQNFYTKFDEPTGFIYSVGGSAKKSMENSPLKEYYEKYTNGGFVGGDIIKFKYDGKDFTRKVESVDEMGNAVVNIMKTQKATINPADVFEIKKEKDDKSIIIEKIGLNEENANFLIGLSPTFAVWLADSIVDTYTTIEGEQGLTREQSLNILNKNPRLLTQLRERIRGILDWLQHPTTRKQNLRELTFVEAERKAKEWHDELQTAGGDIDFVEPIENTVITEYPENDNGVKYYWVFIPQGYCDIESARMGHCGRTGAGSLISLRSIRPYTEDKTITDSHVTIAYNKEDGLFYQSKGKRNAKPSEKYFPYIFDLIKMMASGQVTEKFKLSQQEKIKELEGQKIELEKEVNKLQKYFESKEARTENVELLVKKAGVLQEVKNKLQNINSQIEKLNEESSFDFNGFGSEYQSSNDYGYEDMTKEQVKELYDIKPDMFNDFAGQFMLYEAGLSVDKPNTTIVIEKSAEYVADLLRLDRDLSDDFVTKVLTGETYDWFSGSDSWRYYFENAGNYVDELKGNDYESVLDKIVEITGYDKEEVKENGAEYYLNGKDENFDSDSFDDIKRAIASALESSEESAYVKYYYEQIESALEELGTIEKLDDTGVVINIDLSNLLTNSEISAYMKDLESESLEDVFFEAESNGGISLPSLSIDDRYTPYPENWQKYFDINNYEDGGVIYQDLSKIKPMVVNDNTVLTEFELKKSKSGVEINDKIRNSDDVVNILRKIWEEDTINAYEQAYVLFLNKNNKVIGYYHHSNGGIDGTIMDIQMISGMAVKSLAKGVIIAHNHPSGNATPSPADNQVTKQLSEALKLFNIQLLDSIIITEKSYLSFANEGLI